MTHNIKKNSRIKSNILLEYQYEKFKNQKQCTFGISIRKIQESKAIHIRNINTYAFEKKKREEKSMKRFLSTKE